MGFLAGSLKFFKVFLTSFFLISLRKLFFSLIGDLNDIFFRTRFGSSGDGGDSVILVDSI